LLDWCDRAQHDAFAKCDGRVLYALIPKLHTTNSEHFQNSLAISSTIHSLQMAVQNHDADASWRAFVVLTETPGHNFGTWAI
jgi:hypothetical protein